MATEDEASARAYALVALGSLCYASFTFVWFSFPAFLSPVVAELGLSSTLAGVVNGAIPLTYIPVALASGLVIDRIGPRRSIGIGLAVLGVAQALRSTVDGFAGLLLLTVVIGIGGTGITFGLPKLVSVVVPSRRLGSATSVYMVGASVGTAAAFSLGRPVLGPLLGGWRPVFLWSGVVAVAIALGWVAAATAIGVDRTSGRDAAPSRSLAGVRDNLRTVFTNRGMRLLVVIGTMYLFVMHGTQAWLAAIVEHRGFSAAFAAGLTTLLVVARTVGVLSIPPLSDHLGVRRGVLVACGVLVALGIGGLALSPASAWISVAVVVVAGFGLGGISPLIRTLPIELRDVGPRLTGTATGMIFAVGEIGGFLGPFLLGSLFDLTGTYVVGLGTLAVGGLVVVVAATMMPETGRRTREPVAGD